MSPYDRQAYGIMGLQNVNGPCPAWDENMRNRAAMARQIEESRKASKSAVQLKITLGDGIVAIGNLFTAIGRSLKNIGYSISKDAVKISLPAHEQAK